MGEDSFSQNALDEAEGCADVNVLDVEGLILSKADMHGSLTKTLVHASMHRRVHRSGGLSVLITAGVWCRLTQLDRAIPKTPAGTGPSRS